MDAHYIIDALHNTGYFPDFDGVVNLTIFGILFVGFFSIVVRSKKYRYLLHSIEKYF